jgi:hypothetical protein
MFAYGFEYRHKLTKIAKNNDWYHLLSHCKLTLFLYSIAEVHE